MGRAEIRRAKKEQNKKQKVYVLNEQQIKLIKLKTVKDAQLTLIAVVLGISMLALRDLWKFGPKRLKEFANKFLDIYYDMNAGYLDWNDMYDAIEDETGFDITKLLKERIDKKDDETK